MVKQLSVVAAVVMVAASSCGTAVAQVATPTAPADPSTATVSGVSVSQTATDEIVVTAQRRSDSLSRTPVAVSVLGSEALQKQGIIAFTAKQRERGPYVINVISPNFIAPRIS